MSHYVRNVVVVISSLVVSDFYNSMGYRPPDSSVHGFPRQEYRSGLLFPSPGDLPNPGIEPGPPALQVDSFPNLYNLVNTQHSVFECFSIMYSCHFFWY